MDARELIEVLQANFDAEVMVRQNGQTAETVNVVVDPGTGNFIIIAQPIPLPSPPARDWEEEVECGIGEPETDEPTRFHDGRPLRHIRLQAPAPDAGNSGTVLHIPTWVFQANPNYYDLAAALRRLRIIRWRVAQNRNEIHRGDTIYLWLSGRQGGLLARGTAITEPTLLADMEEEQEDDSEFVLVPEDDVDTKLWIDIRIDMVFETPLTRQQSLQDSILRSMDIIRRPFAGTNFRVTPEESARVRTLGY